ncbi:MAG: pyridoxal phosphate-dependent aminotransferase [Acidobacteriota bacterium]
MRNATRTVYMAWAKNRPVPSVDLAGSNLLACTLADLPGARDAVDLSGDSPNGYPPLLEAIAARAGVSTDQVATAGGCSGANFLACAAVLRAGDEVLAEWPGYDPLPAAARMLGASVSFFRRSFDRGWALEPDRVEAALTPRTRLVIVSSPHNPSGVAASPASLEALARLAERRGFYILVDEVYADTVDGASHGSPGSRSPAVISTNSLTKAYGLSSLRCGWSIAAPSVTEAIRRARDVVDVSGAIPAERLSALAFAHLPALALRAEDILARNRLLWSAFFRKRPELACVPADASVVFPRFEEGRDASAFTERLFERTGVAVAPGSFFGAPEHFRVALGGSTENLERGLDAIAQEISGPA